MARKACSGSGLTLALQPPRRVPPGERHPPTSDEQALFPLQYYCWEQTSKGEIRTPGESFGIILFSPVVKQMKSSTAPSEGFECGLLSPP